MAETNLTQDQARALLEKLAQDDTFRTLFETAPAQALYLLGVDAETIVHLPPRCLCPSQLAPKDHFEDLIKSCAEETIGSMTEMLVPKIGFTNR